MNKTTNVTQHNITSHHRIYLASWRKKSCFGPLFCFFSLFGLKKKKKKKKNWEIIIITTINRKIEREGRGKRKNLDTRWWREFLGPPQRGRSLYVPKTSNWLRDSEKKRKEINGERFNCCCLGVVWFDLFCFPLLTSRRRRRRRKMFQNHFRIPCWFFSLKKRKKVMNKGGGRREREKEGEKETST